MSGDYSRYIFDPTRDYDGVLLQQGRPLTDWDWNDLVAQIRHRKQAGNFDTFGGIAVVPRTIPDSFKMSFDGNGNLTIGRGRIYVDGLLAENHGTAPLLWDAALAELYDQNGTLYTQQPYLPNPSALPTDGNPHLVYLDVWEREVTQFEAPELVEKALGVDTTTRIQIVWQVKVLANTHAVSLTCTTDLRQDPDWNAVTAPSGGRLTTTTASYGSPTPCLIPPSGGYTGLENQLYRVEIHQGGKPGVATFKWSRDNASVETWVTNISVDLKTLTVESVGRDDVLRFNNGDWIEITDDNLELADSGITAPRGELHRISVTGGVDDALRTILLDTPVSAGISKNGNARIRRWDQSGQVLRTDTAAPGSYFDLEGVSSTGAIPVPVSGNITIALENGIVVSFDMDPAGGAFRSGDYWLFAARSNGAWVEPLKQSPPRGIHHHYAKLAIITFPATLPSDCRTHWPPIPHTGSGGCCSVTVGPADLTATNTLQSIFDQYGQKLNALICLQAGDYSMTQPLRLTSAHSGLTIRGCDGVVFRATAGAESAFQDGMVVIDNASNFTLSGIQFIIPEAPFTMANGQFAGLPLNQLAPDVQSAIQNLYVSIGIRAVNSPTLTIKNCQFDFGDFEKDLAGKNAFGVGVFGGGHNDCLQLEGNKFNGIGDFLAGYILTSAVTFTPPSTGVTNLKGSLKRAVSVGFNKALNAVKSDNVAASPGPGGAVMAAASASNNNIPTRLYMQNVPLRQAAAVPMNIMDTAASLQKIISFIPTTVNFAANGGSVLSATLTGALIKDNHFSGMTAAVLILAESGVVNITGNSVNHGNAGFWLLAPEQGSLLAVDPLILSGTTIAMGYPLPQGDTSKPTVVEAAPAPVRIYTGTSTFTDIQGNVWTPDISSKAVTINGGTLYHTIQQITGDFNFHKADQALYQSERYGDFTYTFNNLPDGYYQVTLKFAEIFYATDTNSQGAKLRVFNVSINSDPVLPALDVFASAGGRDIAYDQVFNNIIPIGGQIVIQFAPTYGSQDKNAKIAAVEIASQLYQSDPSETDNFFIQLETLTKQVYANLTAAPLQLRMDGNTVDQAASIAVMVVDFPQKSQQSLLTMDFPQKSQQSLLTMNNNILRRTQAPQNEILTPLQYAALYQPGLGQMQQYPTAIVAGVYAALYQLGWGQMQQYPTAIVAGVNVSSITGNQILNPVNDGISLILENFDKTPGVVVTGNVFQGKVRLPSRNLPTSVPDPLNSWRFLNTEI